MVELEIDQIYQRSTLLSGSIRVTRHRNWKRMIENNCCISVVDLMHRKLIVNEHCAV